MSLYTKQSAQVNLVVTMVGSKISISLRYPRATVHNGTISELRDLE